MALSGAECVYRLDVFEEAVGMLFEISENHGAVLARIGRLTLILPADLGAELSSCIGRRVGILRTESSYRWRVLDHVEDGNDAPRAMAGGEKGVGSIDVA